MRWNVWSVLWVIGVMAATNLSAVEPMERGVDTEAAWERQEDSAAEVTGPEPVFTGMLVWSGRADRNYQPFFQWEMRLRAGTEDLRNVRLRVQPLGPDLMPLDIPRQGHWQRLGNLASGEETDLSYKINTPIFPAYRITLQWQGGSASYLATDRTDLPTLEADTDGLPQLVVLDPMWERNARGQTMVAFWLRNQGSGEAQGVKLTLRLRDGDGTVLLEHPYIPEDGVIPAGYAQRQKVLIERSPSFHNVQIGVTSDEANSMHIDGGSLSDAAAVEIGEITQQDGTLHGKLRNGTAEDIHNVQVQVSLLDKQQTPIAEVATTIDQVAAGSVSDWQIDLSEVPDFSGFETGLSYGVAGAGDDQETEAAHNGPSGGKPQIDVDGLSFTIDDSTGQDGALSIRGELHNRSGDDLKGLVVEFAIPGLDEPITTKIGDLAADARVSVNFVAEGIEALSGLGLSWRSGDANP